MLETGVSRLIENINTINSIINLIKGCPVLYLRVPSVSKMCGHSFFKRSFMYVDYSLWNIVDLDIRLLPFDAFKKGSRYIFI